MSSSSEEDSLKLAASTLLEVADHAAASKSGIAVIEQDFIKGQPSAGFIVSEKSSEVPWERYMAFSTDGSRAQCLLCGRISAKNTWRLRAHFTGTDAHVKLCSQITPDIEHYVNASKLSVGKESEKKPFEDSDELTEDGYEEEPNKKQDHEVDDHTDFEDIGIDKRFWKVPLLDGFQPVTNVKRAPWMMNIATSVTDDRAQCLLCGRISKKNTARLRSHFYGGDRHVAQCPSMSKELLEVLKKPTNSVNRKSKKLKVSSEGASSESAKGELHQVGSTRKEEETKKEEKNHMFTSSSSGLNNFPDPKLIRYPFTYPTMSNADPQVDYRSKIFMNMPEHHFDSLKTNFTNMVPIHGQTSLPINSRPVIPSLQISQGKADHVDRVVANFLSTTNGNNLAFSCVLEFENLVRGLSGCNDWSFQNYLQLRLKQLRPTTTTTTNQYGQHHHHHQQLPT